MYDSKRTHSAGQRARCESSKRRNARSAVYRPYVWRFVCCLVGVLGEVSGGFRARHEVQGMTGATLLSESAGGYVLVAVISFLVAVVFTPLCVRLHERNGRMTKEKKEGTR